MTSLGRVLTLLYFFEKESKSKQASEKSARASVHELFHLVQSTFCSIWFPRRELPKGTSKQASKQVDIQDGPWIKIEDSSILQPSPPENRLESASKTGRDEALSVRQPDKCNFMNRNQTTHHVASYHSLLQNLKLDGCVTSSRLLLLIHENCSRIVKLAGTTPPRKRSAPTVKS